VPATEKPT
jgi:hypothetical protein